MNPLDRDNLNFIMTADPQTLKAFYEEIDTQNLCFVEKQHWSHQLMYQGTHFIIMT